MAAEIAAICGRFVDSEPGYAVLTGLRELPKPSWTDALAIVSAFIGTARSQDSSGSLVREVKDRGTLIGEGRSARYSDSRYGGSLHTDGAEVDLPVPNYITLLCVRQAPMGGDFVMVCAQAVYERLQRENPEAARILAEPFYFDRRGETGANGERTAVKPIFFHEDSRLCATYLREYIEAGHRQPGAPALTEAQRGALDMLDAKLADESLYVKGRLEPGELIINNKRMFHGRSTFEDGHDVEQKRLLLRMWLDKRH